MNEDRDLRDFVEGPTRKLFREFFAAREYVIHVASYPGDEFVPPSSGKVPFAIDDGETLYAIIFPNGEIEPFPIDWELEEEDTIDDEDLTIMTEIASSGVPGGLLRYIPVRKDFQLPDDEDFKLDRLAQQSLLDGPPTSDYEFDGLEYFLDLFLDTDTGDLFTGVATLHWDNENLRKEASFIDGELEGRMTWWYENGQKELEDEYRESLRHGIHRAWHKNGERWAEGSSVNGDPQGTWRWWHDNGQLAEETEYADGLTHGKHEKWHPNGTRALLTYFKEGHEHGIHTEWYESGQLQAIMPMVDGEVHGIVQMWDEDGEQEEDIAFFKGEQVIGAPEDIADEEVDGLKERVMELVGSKEAREAAARFIKTVEEEAAGNLELVAAALRSLVEDLEQGREDRNPDVDANIALIEATEKGDVKEVRRLLKEGKGAENGPPAFAYAIVNNQPKAFEVYVEHGTDVSKPFDWQNPDGSSVFGINALILAAAGGIVWAVKRLMDLGIDPNTESSMGQTALEVAISGGQEEVIDILFEKISDLSHPSAGRVLVAAAMTGNTEVLSRCLKVGINADATDSRSWTALKYAVSQHNLETAELLLENGADCNIADDEGWTPLLNAIESRDPDLVDLLLSKGADPDTAPDVEDDEGQRGFSALMRAAYYGEVGILKSLIAAGAELAQTDSDGAAAIHYASLHRRPACLEILLKRGADSNAIGTDGHTAVGMFLVGLVTALAEGDEIDEDSAVETMNLLLEYGGDWQEAANKPVAEVDDKQITMLDTVNFILKERAYEKLSDAIAQVS